MWDLERHPAWCNTASAGCGIHAGEGIYVSAEMMTDNDGYCPDVITAPLMDAAGQAGVSMSIERPGWCEAVRLLPGEARRIAANLIAAADAAEAPTTRTRRTFADTLAGAR
jgi:hypothetical protein